MARYIDLVVVKDRLGKQVVENEDHDAKLEMLIGAASRAIDNLCHRPAGGFVGQQMTRVYDVPDPRLGAARWGDVRLTRFVQSGRGLVPGDYQVGMEIGRWASVTTVKTDDNADGTYETTWASTDYDLLPLNAPLDGQPYTALRQALNGTKSLLPGPNRLQIVGIFGEVTSLTDPPEPIREACYLIVSRLFARRTSPYGTTGQVREFGGTVYINQVDPDVEQLLAKAGYIELICFA